MRTIADIEKEIQTLQNSLGDVEGSRTEVYSRIVGYYRSLTNWNKGKREEYNHRVTFSETVSGISGKPLKSAFIKPEAAASYTYFFRKSCPNCPPVKNYLSGLTITGSNIDVDEKKGFAEAEKFGVCSAPTVIFFDTHGTEVFRANTLKEIEENLTLFCDRTYTTV